MRRVATVVGLGSVLGCSSGAFPTVGPAAGTPAALVVGRDVLARVPWTERLYCFGGGDTTGFTFPATLAHVGRDSWGFAPTMVPGSTHLARLIPPEGNDVRTACVDSVLRGVIEDLSSTTSWTAPCDGFHTHAGDDELLSVELQLTFKVDGPRSELVSVEPVQATPQAR